MNRRTVGTAYEQAALFYLEQRGYEILETNYRCRFGEIDVIARHKGYLVFLEVKYRSHGTKGRALEAVTRKKQAVITKVAAWYLMERRLGDQVPCRFDVVGIDAEEVTVLENAFSCQ